MKTHTPSMLEQATALLSAARACDGPLRAYYCAKARLAFTGIAAEVETLKLNLDMVEATLTEGKSDG